MIKIEITDPANESKETLVATARFLMELAGHQMVEAPKEEPSKQEVPVKVLQEFHQSMVDGLKETEDFVKKHINCAKVESPKPVEDEGFSENNIHGSFTKKQVIKNILNPSSVGYDDLVDEVIEKTKKKRKPKKEEQLDILGTGEAILPMPTEVIPPPFAHCSTPTPEIPPPPKMDFNVLIAKITRLTAENKIDNAKVLEIVRSHGLDKTHYLSTNPYLVEAVNLDIDKFVEGR